MRGALIRVGVDQTFGHWNAPVDPDTNEFIYVAIPPTTSPSTGDGDARRLLKAPLDAFLGSRGGIRPDTVGLPAALADRQMHLDPDFDRLTYGDNGERRGKRIAAFSAGDLLVFFAGLRPCRPCQHRLTYAIIGVYRVGEVVRVADVARARWADNAHTRRLKQRSTDVIVRAQPGVSGRLRACIPIGEWRSRAYRVRGSPGGVGGLSCRDGFIQRSGPAALLDRTGSSPGAAEADVPGGEQPGGRAMSARVIIVVLRQPRSDEDARTDPFFEFGSFGLTGCHAANLLHDEAADGARLAFAQGGPLGFRLVTLTPPVEVRGLAETRGALEARGDAVVGCGESAAHRQRRRQRHRWLARPALARAARVAGRAVRERVPQPEACARPSGRQAGPQRVEPRHEAVAKSQGVLGGLALRAGRTRSPPSRDLRPAPPEGARGRRAAFAQQASRLLTRRSAASASRRCTRSR
ncbi:MAG: hypothetical protein IPL61_19670 [Myxococcales bacterium]|nr:hypothetical protein [Myxococcales bacterium]